MAKGEGSLGGDAAAQPQQPHLIGPSPGRHVLGRIN